MTSRENQQYVGPLPTNAGIVHFHVDHNAPALPPKPLHNHSFQFLLSLTVVPREI